MPGEAPVWLLSALRLLDVLAEAPAHKLGELIVVDPCREQRWDEERGTGWVVK